MFLMNNKLLNTFKQLALGVYQSQMPATTTAGRVVSTEPLKIKPNEMLYELPASMIDVPDTFSMIESTFEIEVPTFRMEGESIIEESRKIQGKLTFDNTLKVDDIVHLVQKAGGQRYLVIGRLQK